MYNEVPTLPVPTHIDTGGLANYQFRSGDIEAARRSLGDAFEFLRDVDPAQNRQYWNCLMDRAWMSCAQGNITQASADLQLLATYLNDGTDPGRRERCKVQIVAAEIAFVCGDMPKAISLLSLELETSDSWTAVYKFQILTNLAVYHAVSGNGNTALQLTRTVLEEFGDRDWSLVSEEYQYILVPAAAAAVVHDRARLGAIILGHWKHYWLNGRVILATEAPAYEKVLELLRTQFSTDEMNQLFDAGAAVLPESVLEYVRSDRLFAPTPQTNTLQTEV